MNENRVDMFLRSMMNKPDGLLDYQKIILQNFLDWESNMDDSKKNNDTSKSIIMSRIMPKPVFIITDDIGPLTIYHTYEPIWVPYFNWAVGKLEYKNTKRIVALNENVKNYINNLFDIPIILGIIKPKSKTRKNINTYTKEFYKNYKPFMPMDYDIEGKPVSLLKFSNRVKYIHHDKTPITEDMMKCDTPKIQSYTIDMK